MTPEEQALARKLTRLSWRVTTAAYEPPQTRDFTKSHTEDAISMPANHPALRGRDAISTWYVKRAAGRRMNVQIDVTNADIVGDVAIVSCNSAVPTAPWIAAGRFEDDQAARLARCLKLLGDGGYFRVVLIHHPPNQEQAHPRLGLYGAKAFRRVVAEQGAELVLHGHTHQSSIYAIPGPRGDVPVVNGVANVHVYDPSAALTARCLRALLACV